MKAEDAEKFLLESEEQRKFRAEEMLSGILGFRIEEDGFAVYPYKHTRFMSASETRKMWELLTTMQIEALLEQC